MTLGGAARQLTRLTTRMASLPRGSVITMSRFDRCLVPGAECCDLSSLTFIDAFGVVATASSILAAANAGDLPRVALPAAPQMLKHLTGMGLLHFLRDIGVPFEPDAAPINRGDVVVPLTRISNVFEAEQLSELLWANAARWDAQVLEVLTEGLWELAANALEHSGADAMLMGQVYERGEPPDHDGRVQIVIGDAGRGIRASFLEGSTRSPATDIDAIELALEYLVSSVPDPGRGQGLTSTVEQTTELEGKVVIRSGGGRVIVDRAGSSAKMVEPISATVVGISLPLYPGTS